MNLPRIKDLSFQSTVIQFAGSALGVISTLFIYPLDLELYGVYGYLTNTASLLVPFISIGFGAVLLRFYPQYKDLSSAERHGFFGFIFSGYGMGITIFSLLFLPGLHGFVNWIKPGGELEAYIWFLWPFTVVLVLYDFTAQLCINFSKIQWTAWAALLFKFILPVVFLFTFWQFLSRAWFIVGLCMYYLLVVSWIIWKLMDHDKLGFRWIPAMFNAERRNSLLKFAAFSVLSGASSVIALRMDSFFVGSLEGAEANGLFTLAMFMSNVVFIPATAITDALNPSVAKSSYTFNREELSDLYKKSSSNMLLSTVFMSVILWISFEPLHWLMPHSDRINTIKTALLFLLLARIMDAGTGVNHHILSYSKQYRFELYLLCGMAIMNVLLNLSLIPAMGISGAALATLISIGVYNLLKTILVWFFLRIQPFTRSTWIILLTGVSIVVVFSFPITLSNHLIDLLAKSIGAASLYLAIMFWSKCSPEMNAFAESKRVKILKYFKSTSLD